MGKRQRNEYYRKQKEKKRAAESNSSEEECNSRKQQKSSKSKQTGHEKTSGNKALERLQGLVENEKSYVHQPRNLLLKSCWNKSFPNLPPSDELKLTRKELGIRTKQEGDDSSTTVYCAPPLSPSCFRNNGVKSSNESKVYSSGSDLPQLFHTVFSDNKKYKDCTPTPIQLQVWPAMLSTAHNLFNIAPTGSGKTLAYVLPLVQLVLRMLEVDEDGNKESKGKKPSLKSEDGPLAIIMLPTRELAKQVDREVKGICRTAKNLYPDVRIRSMALYGGESKKEQVEGFIESGFVHILAATPGRLIDILADRVFSLRNVVCLVLDEADRMLQLGFIESMDSISKLIRSDRLTCFFSATCPSKLADVCNIWLPQPRVNIRASTVTLNINHDTSMRGNMRLLRNKENTIGGDYVGKDTNYGDNHESVKVTQSRNLELASIPSNVKQILHVCAGHKKPKKLVKILTKLRKKEEETGVRNQGLCIIFFNKIKTLNYIKKYLSENVPGRNSRISELHGKMPQFARDSALLNFRVGKFNTLLATDVVARGIHVSNVAYVINYDFPGSLEQYVHRCGRAGRNSRAGKNCEEKKSSSANVYSFFSREFAPMAPDMLSLLQSSKSEYIDPNLVQLAREVTASRDKLNEKKDIE